MEFNDVIIRRRSVRKYTETQVPEQVIRQSIRHALLAPNSSNLQPWEFYWVRDPQKKQELVNHCLGQSAARTAKELIVVAARLDTWNRNRKLLIESEKRTGKQPRLLNYYGKVIPVVYFLDPINILGFSKWLFTSVAGLFRPVPRMGFSRSSLFESITKTTALACENFMLSIVSQGFSCCPMEGFDETRVKALLKLPQRNSHVVMVISVGEQAVDGIWGDQVRLPEEMFFFEV
jgi:nitroreductase